MSFLKELTSQTPKEYVFREQTIVWKHPHTDEYMFYFTVILETEKSPFPWNRFDYPAFNHGVVMKKQT